MFQNNLLMAASAATSGPSLVSVGNSSSFPEKNQSVSRTQAAGSNTVWTFSGWLYKCKVKNQVFLNSGTGSAQGQLGFSSTGQVYIYNGATVVGITGTLYRDIGWYHFHLAYNTGATGTDKAKLSINGSLVTYWSTDARSTAGAFTDMNQNTKTILMGNNNSTTDALNFDGYIAEAVLLDGTASAVTNFGEFDETGLYWTPLDSDTIKELTFGTNGFYLDNTTNAQTDASGNGNNFTNNNTVTLSTHTPTKSWPLLSTLVNQGFPGDTLDLSVGNQKTTYDGTSTTGIALSPIGFPGTGKFVAQVTVDDVASNGIGWVCLNPDGGMLSSTVFVVNEARWIGLTSGNWIHVEYVNFSGGSNLGTVKTSASDGDVLQLEWDNGTLTVQINGTRYTPSNWTAVDTSKTWTFMSRCPGAGIETWDWGQNGFTPVDASYSYLNTETLAAATTRTASDTGEYWNNFLYTGNGNTPDARTGMGFQPDFTWFKNRDDADGSLLFDSVRGNSNYLRSDSSIVQGNSDTTQRSFDTDGFTIGDNVAINASSETYVAWCAKLGGAPTATNSAGAGATPTAGSVKIDGVNLGSALAGSIAALKITANTTLGMSAITYTGTGANATVGHGLGVAPAFIIIKDLDAPALNWVVGSDSIGWTKYLHLNLTNAEATGSFAWNDTAPTSTTFSLGTWGNSNTSGKDYIAYCFAPSEFISIGSYEGNGNADGAFVPTVNSLGIPMQPVWAMTKSIDSTSNWDMYDNKRLGYNVENAQLWANLATAEATADNLDIVTGGLKMRIATDPNVAETYVYMAIGTPIIDTDGRIIGGR